MESLGKIVGGTFLIGSLFFTGCSSNQDKKFKAYNPITKDTAYFSDELTALKMEGEYLKYSYLKDEESHLKEMFSILRSYNDSLSESSNKLYSISKDITNLYEEGIAIADSILESNRRGLTSENSSLKQTNNLKNF